jgi:hypothetical protein
MVQDLTSFSPCATTSANARRPDWMRGTHSTAVGEMMPAIVEFINAHPAKK